MKSVGNVKSITAPFLRSALLVGAVLLLGGCVTTVGYESPQYEVSGQIEQPPPALPVYEQPPCPGDGYLWVPGYWAYSGGYYWVPGAWELPPRVGLLWTPGYWDFAGAAYVWHAGYWGRHVGFYGGVRYGYGYDGVGYRGGRWEGDHFVYNRYVSNVNGRIVHHTYMERESRRFGGDRASYDGGRGGIVASPTRENLTYAHEEHLGDTPSQRTRVQQAARNSALFARANSGNPPVAPIARPGHFPSPGIARGRGAEGWAPHALQSNGQPPLNFPPRLNVQRSANIHGHPNVQVRTVSQARPAFYGQRPGVRPPARQPAEVRRGPSGHSRGAPASGKKSRAAERDR